jgi:diguanylate cyclase (GGDEF)-like protein
VLLIGLDDAAATSLASDEGIDVTRQATLDGPLGAEPDVIVLALDGAGPLETIRAARSAAPDAAIVVVTDADRAADGAIALHAGAEDHLVRDEAFLLLLPRAVRYAVAMRRMRRELATVDEVTELPNLRGFAPIAEHHLRLADRGSDPVVFVFVRLDDHARQWREEGPDAAESLARDAASVVLEAVRDADVPARIAPDTLCVLLTGAAAGAETFVLSRLVEAMAVHDARLPRPRSLALSVGTARYEPGTGARLSEILETAVRGLSART